jgi:hypothetical protein
MTRHLFVFQISAKNKDIKQYGEAVLLDVTTKEKGENNASVMCLIYMCTYSTYPQEGG